MSVVVPEGCDVVRKRGSWTMRQEHHVHQTIGNGYNQGLPAWTQRAQATITPVHSAELPWVSRFSARVVNPTNPTTSAMQFIRIAFWIVLLVSAMLLSFLPGGYDPLATSLSVSATVVAFGGLL
jgi:hypothetical protein